MKCKLMIHQAQQGWNLARRASAHLVHEITSFFNLILIIQLIFMPILSILTF